MNDRVWNRFLTHWSRWMILSNHRRPRNSCQVITALVDFCWYSWYDESIPPYGRHDSVMVKTADLWRRMLRVRCLKMYVQSIWLLACNPRISANLSSSLSLANVFWNPSGKSLWRAIGWMKNGGIMLKVELSISAKPKSRLLLFSCSISKLASFWIFLVSHGSRSADMLSGVRRRLFPPSSGLTVWAGDASVAVVPSS